MTLDPKYNLIAKKTITKIFTYKGYTCVIKFLPAGYRCGYVGIPKENVLYDFNERDLNMLVNCHGGITYDKKYLYGYFSENEYRWIGFDCYHVGDAKDLRLAKETYGNDLDFAVDMHDVDILLKFHNEKIHGVVRSEDYVKTECEIIVEQLISMNNLVKLAKKKCEEES